MQMRASVPRLVQGTDARDSRNARCAGSHARGEEQAQVRAFLVFDGHPEAGTFQTVANGVAVIRLHAMYTSGLGNRTVPDAIIKDLVVLAVNRVDQVQLARGEQDRILRALAVDLHQLDALAAAVSGLVDDVV